jgi:DNA topoisomerase-3
VASLASPELTGAWEARLARIARGLESRAAFMADIARYVAEIVDAIRTAAPAVAAGAAPSTAQTAVAVGRCPRCSASVVERPREFACSAGCGFAMSSRVAGRAIGSTLAAVLLERRRSEPLRGFRSKAGKTFAAALVLEDDGALRFDFDSDRKPAGEPRSAPRPRSDRPRSKRPLKGERRARSRSDRSNETGSSARFGPARSTATARPDRTRAKSTVIGELGCPRCGQGTLITGARGWGCARWREGCRFVIWFQTAGRRLTAAQLRDLVTRGKTRKAKFRTERGAELDGRLVLEPGADGGARLEPS